ncbi:hypothetical protein, partial [Salmonella enterica]|uniref:hypothetical protein n=1 Tax=Salmonella enterica TaxID=28901 RepID=UPI001C548F9D
MIQLPLMAYGSQTSSRDTTQSWHNQVAACRSATTLFLHSKTPGINRAFCSGEKESSRCDMLLPGYAR